MLPSNEHTFILQIVNTYSHGCVTSQCDITYISWTYWVQILPINVQYYQSAFMPFIEHIALLLLELQDPQGYESIYKAGFYVKEGARLCAVEEMEEQCVQLLWKEQHFANTQNDEVSVRRVLQPQAEEIQCIRHQNLAVGGRSVEDNELW